MSSVLISSVGISYVVLLKVKKSCINVHCGGGILLVLNAILVPPFAKGLGLSRATLIS